MKKPVLFNSGNFDSQRVKNSSANDTKSDPSHINFTFINQFRKDDSKKDTIAAIILMIGFLLLMVSIMCLIDYRFNKKQSFIYKLIHGQQTIASLIKPGNIEIRFK